jgi:Uncharacterised nucleotidyltransferase
VTVDAAFEPAPDSKAREALWQAVEHKLAPATLEGIQAHKLGPLAAWYLRARGEAVPPSFFAEERAAAAATLMTRPLLEHVRAGCEGPIVLVKGPEVARLYPGQRRMFVDIDLIVPDASAVQRELLAAGFVEAGWQWVMAHFPLGEYSEKAHHLRPLKRPELSLKIEIHKRPSWPERLVPPAAAEIVEAAVPSACRVDGILAPDPSHHALIVAAHAWKENPLGVMRDLIDIAALSADVPEDELERAAAAWGLGRVWRATRNTTQALLEGRQLSMPVRLWASHLESLRERTVLESHARGLLQGFSMLPPRRAVLESGDAIGRTFRPHLGEPWRHKLARAFHAVRHPRQAHSVHVSESRKRSAKGPADT